MGAPGSAQRKESGCSAIESPVVGGSIGGPASRLPVSTRRVRVPPDKPNATSAGVANGLGNESGDGKDDQQIMAARRIIEELGMPLDPREMPPE
jgi:hypothetical protein